MTSNFAFFSLYCFCYMFFAPERSGPKNTIKYGGKVYIYFATVRTVAKYIRIQLVITLLKHNKHY
jgi:hypothetical protein